MKGEYTMTRLTSEEVEICHKALRERYEDRIDRLTYLGWKNAGHAVNLGEFLREEYSYTKEEVKLIQEGKSKEVIEARDAKNEARQREILDEFYLKGEE